MARALDHCKQIGITTERILTDNGPCYRSHLWRDLLQDNNIKHKRTRPYRPQTNGKVERFHRTLADEWAYARPYRSERQRREASRHGCIGITTTAATPHSEATHPPPAFPTSQGNTIVDRSRRRAGRW